jgi:hypothetical protein
LGWDGIPACMHAAKEDKGGKKKKPPKINNKIVIKE